MALRLTAVAAIIAVVRATSLEDLAREEALEAEGALERRALQTATLDGSMHPLAGPDLPLSENGQAPLNEPCYTHGDMCSGCEQHTPLPLATLFGRITFKHD